MATYTYYVDPGGTGDYTTFAAFEAARQSSHNGSGNIVVAECKRTTSTEDTGTVSIQGWGTGVTCHLYVHPDYRHQGKNANTRTDNGNYIYRIAPSASWVLSITDSWASHATIEGLLGTSSYASYIINANSAGTKIFKSCFFRNGNSGVASCAGSYSAGEVNFFNCVLIAGSYEAINTGQPARIYNCNLINTTTNTYALYNTNTYGGYTVMLNSYTRAAWPSSDCWSTVSWQRQDCASSKDDYQYNEYKMYNTGNFTNVTVGSEDFSLRIGSNLISCAGNILGEGYYTDDILGNTRTLPWSQGAFEVQYTGTITKVVDPGGTGDYTSLSAFEAGEQTASYGTYITALCKRTTSALDTTAVMFSGWSNSTELVIEVDEDYRHEGDLYADTRTADGNYIYKLVCGGTYTIKDNTYYKRITLIGFFAENTNATTTIEPHSFGMNNTRVMIIRSIFKSNGGFGIVLDSNPAAQKSACALGEVFSSIFFSESNYAYWTEAQIRSYGCTYISNSTTVCAWGMPSTGYKNDYTFNSYAASKYASGDWNYKAGSFGKWKIASRYNHSTSYVDYPNKAFNTTNFVNVTSGSEDVNLPVGSGLRNLAWTLGVGHTPNVAIASVDIRGVERTGSWDIGAFEYTPPPINFTSSINESSSTTTAVATTFSNINFTANLTESSSTTTVLCAITKELVVDINESTSTTSAILQAIRLLYADASNTTSTTAPILKVIRPLLSALNETSITTTAIINATKIFIANINETTSTTTPTVTYTKHQFANATESTLTSTASSLMTRAYIADANQTSLTTTAVLHLDRHLLANAFEVTFTPSAQVNYTKHLFVTAVNGTSTTTVQLNITNYLSTTMSNSSSTTTAQLKIYDYLVTSLNETSLTSTAAHHFEAILYASANETSTTSTALMSYVYELTSSINETTSSSTAFAYVTRSLVVDAINNTNTTTALLKVSRPLSSTINESSSTTTVLGTINRIFFANISEASSTTASLLKVDRPLVVNLTETTLTSLAEPHTIEAWYVNAIESSVTTNAKLDFSRKLFANLSETTLTSTSVFSYVYYFTVNIGEISTTSDALGYVLRRYNLWINEYSNTSNVQVNVTVHLTASINETSNSTEISNHWELDLTSPLDDLTQVEPPIMLRWGTYPGAANYNLQVATDAEFTSIVTDILTTSSEYEDDTLENSTEYFWRVRAVA